MKRLYIFSLMTLSLCSCWPEIFGERNGKFLKEVIRMDEFNSEYDDYNSDMRYNRSGGFRLTFSSNRKHEDYFNLVHFLAGFTYGKRLGVEMLTSSNHELDNYGEKYGLASKANGPFNVLGPKTMSMQDDFFAVTDDTDQLLLFFADDSRGDLQIKYVRKIGPLVEEPVVFELLNSDKDDAYPTFSRNGDKIYFCSNRDGNFDIYEVNIPRKVSERITLENLIKPQDFTIRKMDELSSAYDDKCPYLFNNTMVFVSNRPGGKGGNDIYFSTLVNGEWTTPQNAGDRINTSYNEYRPILPDLGHFTYNLMVFSSDRPGGKGGFDLYMTGLNDKN
jgi:hypothetical protein